MCTFIYSSLQRISGCTTLVERDAVLEREHGDDGAGGRLRRRQQRHRRGTPGQGQQHQQQRRQPLLRHQQRLPADQWRDSLGLRPHATNGTGFGFGQICRILRSYVLVGWLTAQIFCLSLI